MDLGSDLKLPSQRRIQALLDTTYTITPIVQVVSFLIFFLVNSILTARAVQNGCAEAAAASASTPCGPGGRALPKRMHPAASNNKKKESAIGCLNDFSLKTKLAFRWLNVGILLTYVADAAVTMSHALLKREQHWWCGQSFVVYDIGSFFAYTIILVSLIDTSPSPTLAQLVPWCLSVPLELLILGASASYYARPHHEPIVGDPLGGNLRTSISAWEAAGLAIASLRCLFLLIVVSVYAATYLASKRKSCASGAPDERTPLLQNGETSSSSTPPPETPKPEAAWARPQKLPDNSWWSYLSGYAVFFPYIWPSKSARLQLTVVFCFGLVMLQRVVNVLVPYQVGVITDALSRDHDFYVPWGGILCYILYRWLQGNQGLIGSLRSFLWIPVGQYSYMELSTASFEHVHGLSLEFHLGKKTGEVLSALSKGSSINSFLEQVTFQVIPMLIDLCVAIGFFAVAFDIYYALVVTIITFIYLYVTIRLAQWRTEVRRQMANASRQEDAVKNDSMMSYETVKYFNAEAHEFNRYRGAVSDYQKAEYAVLFSLTLMNTCQNTVFMLGLLITCFIAAFQVASGERPVGQFITLLTYMAQLQGPLNFFGTFYRSIQNSMINAERLLELFREQPTVVDKPYAADLPDCKGDVEFDDVHFSYDPRKPALQGLSFHCKPGTTTALVGESGGGKSTVFRLLFRFYDAQSGEIRIDGCPVDNVTIDSLRRQIGVVPQDTVLFNESIMYNLKYANPDVSDEQVYNACRAASIHDRILTFPDGYQTKVGERGLRLSGGEKQRVAIARTILKDPKIILLDEATAALDTGTEEHIQKALSTLSRGRTVLVIAHRLSTITTADQILVLSGGKVVERGTHEELLAIQDGHYDNMWRKQIRSQKAAVDAQALRDQANELGAGARLI